MTTEQILDRLDDLAEKYNQRRARYWAASEEAGEQAKMGHKIDRRNALGVAYTQELLAHEAKQAMMDIAALTAEMRGLA